MKSKTGDIYKYPEGHKTKIVWISEDKKAIAVRCPQKHLSKVVKVADHTKPTVQHGNNPRKERKIYAENIFFLIRI